MTEGAATPAAEDIRPAVRTRRSPGVYVRTLAIIRWVAVAGQLAAVLAVEFALGFALPVYACLATITALAVSNLWLGASRSWRARLTDYHALRILAFDLVQLCTLLYFTGGLDNPFAMLILAPVTVSATILTRRATVLLTVLALFGATFLAFYSEPLPWRAPGFELPGVYLLGVWTALAVAILFMAAYIWSVSEESRRREQGLAETEAALAREQHMSALGGLAAAAAHELGSPLNTISLIARDIRVQIPADSPLREDAEVLDQEAQRCREILAGLARRPEASGGAPYERTLLTDLAEEAARNHITPEIEFRLEVDPASTGAEPTVPRSPEILHGLGNLIQNASQFARGSVSLALYWSESDVRLVLRDDGPGFPGWLLDALGEPYISTRSGAGGHMGLGIFIAQTLLDRVGADVSYRNRSDGNSVSGAEIVIHWARRDLEREFDAPDRG